MDRALVWTVAWISTWRRPRLSISRNTKKPTRKEIRRTIEKLKNGKASGLDNIPAETLKADLDTAFERVRSLFEKIWKEDKFPDNWKEGLVFKLPEKGDLRDCKKCRGIMLLSVFGKVLNVILLGRMKTTVDSKLCDNQAARAGGTQR